MNFKYVELMFLATKPTRSRWLKVFRETPILEPRRRALGSELLAALQLVRSWRRAGFDGLYNNGDDEDKWSDVKDEEIVQQYDIEGWSTTP
ncbi:hypothetical protein A1F99_075130 [Pyrenophora tritici-repentis]|nr:hypothetical protein A1F99_075130 [Pyrenophora tritici-repentis]